MTLNTTEKGIESAALAERLRFALDIHLQEVKHWASTISFNNMPHNRNLADIYVEPYYYVILKSSSNKHYKMDKITAGTILADDNHYQILGAPGTGKTTSLKRFANILLEQNKTPQYRWKIPIFLRLLELKSGQSVIDKLASILGMGLKNNTQLKDQVIKILNQYGFVVLIDGLDEIHCADRTKVEMDLSFLALNVRESKLIVTCRTSGVAEVITGLKAVEIAPFNDSQIHKCIKYWLPRHGNEFLKEIGDMKINNLMSSPLLLTLLLNIYEKYGHLPHQAVSIYKIMIRFMLEEWDLMRGIIRLSKFSNFEIDKKYEFLSFLAYDLTIGFRKDIFTYAEIERSYIKACSSYGLPRDEASSVIDEVESYSGLLIRDPANSYSFAHKAIQEYLVANYMVRLGELPSPDILKVIPAELALSVTLSSDPTTYLYHVIKTRLANYTYDHSFYDVFIGKLISERPFFRKDDHYQKLLSLLKASVDKDSFIKVKYLFMGDT